MNAAKPTTAYPILLQIRGKKKFVLWVDGGNRPDYLIAERKRVITSPSLRALRNGVSNRNLEIAQVQTDIDIDKAIRQVQKLVPGKSSSPKICKILLDAWNILEDIARTTGKLRTSNSKKTYNKIFWGCNLPSVTPRGKKYRPIWTKMDIARLTSTFSKLLESIDSTHPDEFSV